jgi:hypothetical protein
MKLRMSIIGRMMEVINHTLTVTCFVATAGAAVAAIWWVQSLTARTTWNALMAVSLVTAPLLALGAFVLWRRRRRRIYSWEAGLAVLALVADLLMVALVPQVLEMAR